MVSNTLAGIGLVSGYENTETMTGPGPDKGRGELSSDDMPEVLRLLRRTTPGSDETGSVAWGAAESRR